MNMISAVENQNSCITKTSYKSTVKAEFTEAVDSKSEEEKLEAFKKEIWKELDSLPWNSSVSVSIQITDSAFKRMMTDEDFKNRISDRIYGDCM